MPRELNILFFGDSNTYGLRPDKKGRYAYGVRFPGQVGREIPTAHIIEEGCPGRTTIYEDIRRPYKRGLDYITPCLTSHTPLDYVVIMLGTNDCKSAFLASAKDITSGIDALVQRVRICDISPPAVLLLAPAPISASLSGGPDYDERSVRVSRELADEYEKLARTEGLLFLDAGTIARVSRADGEHLTAKGHRDLGLAVSKIILRQENKESKDDEVAI